MGVAVGYAHSAEKPGATTIGPGSRHVAFCREIWPRPDPPVRRGRISSARKTFVALTALFANDYSILSSLHAYPSAQTDTIHPVGRLAREKFPTSLKSVIAEKFNSTPRATKPGYANH